MRSEGGVEMVPVVGANGEPLGISGPAEAEILQGLLEANGIDSEVSEPARGFHQMPAYLVLVATNQADEAAAIIAAATAGGAAAAEEAELVGEKSGDLPLDDVNSGSRGLL